MGSYLPKIACELVAQMGQVPCLLCCSPLILQTLYSCGEKGMQSAHRRSVHWAPVGLPRGEVGVLHFVEASCSRPGQRLLADQTLRGL